ncbi:Het-C domain-containing protein [Paucilactobacillus hokkaidonensis]|nr:Het-C domain-containing protein [Paucilactobacillus hokkaidonensis]
MKEKLMQQRQRLQVRLVIWIVTTISFMSFGYLFGHKS